uniref:Uncharacterized protein n=1 Tax=Arundo donax TaxID=35708 RepID=A0A0A9HBZ8_ARUDO
MNPNQLRSQSRSNFKFLFIFC